MEFINSVAISGEETDRRSVQLWAERGGGGAHGIPGRGAARITAGAEHPLPAGAACPTADGPAPGN